MPGHHQLPHLAGSFLRAALLIVFTLAVPAVILDGDLLVLPAGALVLLAWLTIALATVVHWVLIVGAPPLAATARTAAGAAWSAIGDDPVGRRLHSVAARLAAFVRPLRPAGRWLGRRLSPRPGGLALTVATTIAVAGVVVVVWLGRQVDRPRSGLSLFDLRVTEAASRLEVAGERRAMEALTNIGATRSVLVIAALLVAGALAARASRSAVLLTGTLALSSTLVTVLKVTHARPRPALGRLVEHSTSFPSGHAAASLSLALGLVMWWWAAGMPRPSLLAAVAVPTALLIGYSRAYLSIHWLSDVLAAWLVAVAAAAAVFGVNHRVALRHQDRPPSTPRRGLIVLGCVAAVLAATVVAVTGDHHFPTSVPPTRPTMLVSADPATVLAPLPKFSETLLGRRMEPLGLVIVASDGELRAAIAQAGWSIADRPTPGRLAHTYWAGLTGRGDPTAPVTPTFLDTRIQDIAIQQQSLGRGVKARHHARLWRLPNLTPDGCPVWGVTASLDDRVEWTLRTLLPNHHIAPAIDTERDYLTTALANTGRLDDIGRFDFVGPTLGTNAANDPFFTDGKVALLRQRANCT